MSDIVVELRNASNQPTEAILIGSDLLIDAADEIERLRGLITAWADADLAKTPYGPSIHPIIEAEDALRKAVGR